jgi:hypothetical protein
MAIRRDAIQAAVGVAALGWAAREAIKSRRRPELFGVKLPRELDTHKLAKQVGKVADQLERTSEDVRMVSAQAKRLSQRLA